MKVSKNINFLWVLILAVSAGFLKPLAAQTNTLLALVNSNTLPVMTYAAIDISGSLQGNNNVSQVTIDDNNIAYFTYPIGSSSNTIGTWQNGTAYNTRSFEVASVEELPPDDAGYPLSESDSYPNWLLNDGTICGDQTTIIIEDSTYDDVNGVSGQISSSMTACSPSGSIPVPAPYQQGAANQYNVYNETQLWGAAPGVVCGSGHFSYVQIGTNTYPGNIGPNYWNWFAFSFIAKGNQLTIFDPNTSWDHMMGSSNMQVVSSDFIPWFINKVGSASGQSRAGPALWMGGQFYTNIGYGAIINDQNQVLGNIPHSTNWVDTVLWENSGNTITSLYGILSKYIQSQYNPYYHSIDASAISNQRNPAGTGIINSDTSINILATGNMNPLLYHRDNSNHWTVYQQQFPTNIANLSWSSIDGSQISSPINAQGLIAALGTPAGSNNTHAFLLFPVQITSVSFGGDKYWQLESDDATTQYSAPQWSGIQGDSTASQTGEHNYAVAFTRNTKPKISATFKIPSALNWTNLKFKATGPDGIVIPPTYGTVGTDGVTVTLPITESTTTLPNTIKYYNKNDTTAFTLDWQISVDDGANWSEISSTKHTVYVTLADSLDSDNQETIFYLGCQNQGTQTDQTAVAEKIFNQFKLLSVCRVGTTTPMTYWGAWALSSAATTASPDCFSAAGLLKMGDGRCGAWAAFLIDILGAQGISVNGNQSEDVTTVNDPITGHTGAGFLVKNWDLSNPSAPVDLPGVAAQNNSNPQSAFTDHALVSCQGILYDPSYGKEYQGGTMRANLTSWEDAALSAALYSDGLGNTYIVPHTAGVPQTQMNP